MKPKYLQSETGGRDRWTVSYVDVLTILLIFFIAVAAKLPAVVHHDAPAPAPVAPAPVPVAVEKPPLADAQELLAKNGLDARLEDRGLVVSLPAGDPVCSGRGPHQRRRQAGDRSDCRRDRKHAESHSRVRARGFHANSQPAI